MHKHTFLRVRVAQGGFVLVVALILFVVLSLAAVFSMRGSVLQERMAVGQIAMHGSFMESEELAWSAVSCIRDAFFDADGELFPQLPDPVVVAAGCDAPGVTVEWRERAGREPWFDVMAGVGFGETGAFTPVALEIETPGTLGGSSRPPIPRWSAYSCFGPNCQFSPASGRASSAASGANHLSPEVEDGDFACQAQGRAPGLALGGSVPGVVMPEGSFTMPPSTATTPPTNPPMPDIVGNPPTVLSEAAWRATEGGAEIEDARAFIDGLIDPLLSSAVFPGQLDPGQGGIFVAGPGQTISLSSGDSAAAYGVIILDGGELEMNGNQCFSGVVLFRNGGSIVSQNGTPAVLGSVLGYSPTDTEWDQIELERGVEILPEQRVINPRQNGNPSFFFSGDALADADTVIGRITGSGIRFRIIRWRTPVALQDG